MLIDFAFFMCNLIKSEIDLGNVMKFSINIRYNSDVSLYCLNCYTYADAPSTLPVDA